MQIGPRQSFGINRPYSTSNRLLKSHAGQPTPQAILVYPGADSEGDVIRPDGGNWARFRANPVVNLDHGPYIGTGTVEMKSIPDPTNPGERINVPVGVSRIFQSAADFKGLQLPRLNHRGDVVGKYEPDFCLRIASQVGPKIEDGTLDGVSIELHFEPRETESLGRKSQMHRDSLHIHDWDGLGYAHTLVPVNISSRQVLSDASQLKIEKCIRWRDSLPTEMGYLRKSLTRFVDSTRLPTTRTTVALRLTKAIPGGPPQKQPAQAAPAQSAPAPAEDPNEDYFADDGAGADGTAEVAPMDDGQPKPPTAVKETLQLAQSVMDACQACDTGMSASDNPKAIQAVRKMTDTIRSMCAKAQSFADALGQQLQAGTGDAMALEGEDGEESDDNDVPDDASELDEGDDDDTATEPTKPDADAEEGDDEPPVKKKKPDTDANGAVISKSYSEWKPNRIKKSDLGPPVKAKKAVTVDQSEPSEQPNESRIAAVEQSLKTIAALVGRLR